MKQTFFAVLLSLALFSSMAFAQSGTWSAFHACSVGCGGGTTYRDCILDGQQVDYSNCPGGADAATADCNTVPCGTIIGVWSAIHACDLQCMTYRDCIVDGSIADNSYCEGESVQECTIPPCNNVTFPGVWGDFGNCTRPDDDNTTCGAGTQTRDCLVNGTVSNFTDCRGGDAFATRNCSTCTGTWSDWSNCTVSDDDDDDVTCGTGFQTRDCLVNGTISDFINCEGGEDASNRTCPACTGTWSDWGNCTVSGDDVTCGTGFQTRDCLVNGTISNFTHCEGGEDASNRTCPACTGTWSDWGNCTVSGDDVTCRTGFQTRDCLVNGTISNFTNCEGGEDASNRTCPACPGTWSDWGNCSAACGAGTQTRDCLVNGTVSNFTACEGGEDASVRNCTGTNCVFVGVWGAFHACSVGCGGGVTYRDCLVNGAIQRNNSLCEGGDAAATRACNTVPCGTIIGTWSAFQACSVSCGGGIATRNCLVNGSIADPSYCAGNATGPCNTQPCDVNSAGDVVFAGVWSAGHACPVSCGTGETYRDCLVNGHQASYANCEGSSFIPCDTGVPCPFPGAWSAVHACPVSCGGGTTYRDCIVDGQQADYANCEGVSTRPCNTQAC